MGNVGEALTRKLGPFPVWVWAIIGGLVLYVVRNRTAGSGAGGSGPNAQAVQAEAQLLQARAQAMPPPQSPVTLGPGETVYDPNTGNLFGGNSGNNQAESLIALIGALLLRRRHPQRHRHPKGPRHRGHHQVHGGHDHPGHHQPKRQRGKAHK